MNSVTALPLSGDLANVVRGLRGVLGAWGVRRAMSEVLMAMVLRLLGRACSRILRLEALYLAGTVLRVAPRGVVREAVVARVAVERVWPCRFGWLIRSMGPMGYHGMGFGSQLRTILERPEVVALLVAVPQVGRILLPLCRMLAVESSVLRPWVVRPPVAVVAAVVKKRVRRPTVVVDWGRIPLPRGVLAAARRRGFGKVV